MNSLGVYTENGIKFTQDFIQKYAGLVKRIAQHLIGRLPANIQVGDLIQAGMIGLLEAAKNFDNSKGASFETYAGIRIRGSMLDEIRKGDWAPRSVHRNTRKITETINQIENRTGRDAKDNEVAIELGISVAEYHGMLQDSLGARVLGFDDIGIREDSMVAGGLSSVVSEPLDKLQKADYYNKLAKEIARLPERERLVLALYYEEELNLREVGEVLGVSESRISQIHGQAMLRLQARMKNHNVQ